VAHAGVYLYTRRSFDARLLCAHGARSDFIGWNYNAD